jgi:hypothetical protein
MEKETKGMKTKWTQGSSKKYFPGGAFRLLAGVCLLLWLSSPAWANLAAVGIPVEPHGFPSFYQDTGGLQLQLCLDGDGANGACAYDPVQAGNAFSATTGFGAEAFWWLADAQARPLVAGGKSRLVMALEAAYGGVGDPADGNQISFARIRVRIDVAQAGNYRITHPYGVLEFPNVTVADGINYTEDIGSIDPLDPALAFEGALQGKIGPFLTWTDFATDPALAITDPNTGITSRYVGLPGTPHTVTGSPLGTNFFRIEMEDPANPGTFILVDETDLFKVIGKTGAGGGAAYVFPEPPIPALFAVGPVNRASAFVNDGVNPPSAASSNPHPGGVPAVPEFPPLGPVSYPNGAGYPIGYPYYYQDTPTPAEEITAIIAGGGTIADATPGLKLTICPGSDPMCISVPVDPADPQSALLNVGDESFWWAAEAEIANTAGIDRARLIMGLEGAFGGTGVVNEGDQIAFARIRIRIDTPVAGNYTITHPYGEITFENVPAGRRAINYTEDIGNINIITPDIAFNGALYGNIGPFLTWDTFDPTLAPGDPAIDPDLEMGNGILYIGNPAIPHTVTGSSTGNNIFRIQGPGIDVTTNLFTVQGKVYDPATFVPLPPAPGTPVAFGDTIIVDGGATTPIDVLANDTFTPPVAVELLTPAATFGPFDGLAVVNADGTISFTPAAGFAGADSFTYRIIDSAGLISNNATVTITVNNLALGRAELDLRRLLWNIRGTGTTPGATLTLVAGPDLTGTLIGTVLVDAAGKWQFRGPALNAPAADVTGISISSSAGGELLNQPLRIR